MTKLSRAPHDLAEDTDTCQNEGCLLSPKWAGEDSFQDCLLTDFSSLDFIVLIYLVWKLSPRDTIPLEISLSFKQTLQLSTSLMTVSITIVLSSLSGMALPEGNAAGGGGGWLIRSLIFIFLFFSVPGESMEKAFHFHAMESIHQALPFSVSKVYLQVNSNDRCRNGSFLCQGLRKKY